MMGKFMYVTLKVLLAALLHQVCEAIDEESSAIIEPIVSPFTELLYSLDNRIGKYLRDFCDCSHIQSCTCSTQIGRTNFSGVAALVDITEENIYKKFLEIKIYIDSYEIFRESTNVNELKPKCSVFEDRESILVNKTYCINFEKEENDRKVKVCGNLEIKERNKILKEPILCLQHDTMRQEQGRLLEQSNFNSKQTIKLLPKQTLKEQSKVIPESESKQTPKLESKLTP